MRRAAGSGGGGAPGAGRAADSTDAGTGVTAGTAGCRTVDSSDETSFDRRRASIDEFPGRGRITTGGGGGDGGARESSGLSGSYPAGIAIGSKGVGFDGVGGLGTIA